MGRTPPLPYLWMLLSSLAFAVMAALGHALGGAGWVHGILASSTNTVNYGGEGDTVFQRGDIIRDDYVAYCAQGYPGHPSGQP